MKPTVLGVITARAGSKGIPQKNIKFLAGKPLIAHTVEAALASRAFDRLILSTDDVAAAAIAGQCGCEVPFMRPAELAADDTPHLPVMQHAIGWLAEHDNYRPNLVMILMPTSPLRRAIDITNAIDLAVRAEADSVVSVDELRPHFNPMRVVTIDERGWARLLVGGRPVRERPARRQELPKAWVMNGAIYLFRRDLVFEAEASLYGDRVAVYVMPPPYGMNLDEPEDWLAVERLFNSTDRP